MLQIGSIVDGKYKILNKIGQGGMSVVYLAMNERANKQWAIKEVRKDGVQNFEVVKQGLIAETDLLKKLNHPNLPSIIDVIDGDGTFLIVMDYIEGKSLSSILKEYGAQSQEDVIDWSKQMCDVLGYLHSRQPPIIYRDMKPANIMLKPDGKVMLIDFGTAREFKEKSVADTTCLGTQGYAAPEQYGGHGQTDARNVYGMINSMRRNLSDAWYWDANNYTKTYCNNLQPLTYDYALEQVAMKRAAEIALSYSHTRPNGTNYYTAYSENGVYAGVYAENIGVNYSSASALHNAMREDNANYSGQEQRRNMLNSQFTAVGIGHVYYNGYHYWVEEFANTVTRTAYTAPNNQTTTVTNLQVAESNITSDQIVVPPSIGTYIQMSVGQTKDLSGCYENIKVSNHWPGNANCPIVQGLNMYVSNTAVAYISGTKLIANSTGSTTLTLNRPDGKIPPADSGSGNRNQ